MTHLKERLLDSVEFDPNGGCWLWAGSTARGYGKMRVGKRRTALAHRLSWEVHRGPIPEGLDICHRCDVRACINPDHLWLGTKAQNTADMIDKNRGSFSTILGRMRKLEADLAVALAEIARLRAGAENVL